MEFRKLVAVLLVSVSMSATADFTTLELAYEISLRDLTVPVTSSGSLIFKECADCETKLVRMTRNTRFVVNGENVGLKEFRKNVYKVRDRESEIIIVLHHLESNTITSLSAVL